MTQQSEHYDKDNRIVIQGRIAQRAWMDNDNRIMIMVIVAVKFI